MSKIMADVLKQYLLDLIVNTSSQKKFYMAEQTKGQMINLICGQTNKQTDEPNATIQ